MPLIPGINWIVYCFCREGVEGTHGFVIYKRELKGGVCQALSGSAFSDDKVLLVLREQKLRKDPSWMSSLHHEDCLDAAETWRIYYI